MACCGTAPWPQALVSSPDASLGAAEPCGAVVTAARGLPQLALPGGAEQGWAQEKVPPVSSLAGHRHLLLILALRPPPLAQAPRLGRGACGSEYLRSLPQGCGWTLPWALVDA